MPCLQLAQTLRAYERRACAPCKRRRKRREDEGEAHAERRKACAQLAKTRKAVTRFWSLNGALAALTARTVWLAEWGASHKCRQGLSSIENKYGGEGRGRHSSTASLAPPKRGVCYLAVAPAIAMCDRLEVGWTARACCFYHGRDRLHFVSLFLRACVKNLAVCVARVCHAQQSSRLKAIAWPRCGRWQPPASGRRRSLKATRRPPDQPGRGANLRGPSEAPKPKGFASE